VPEGAPLLVTLSHLTKDKGIDVLLDGFGRLLARRPDARLAIVGDGPEEGRLKALARERGLLGPAAFTGQRADVAAVLAAADLYTTTSRVEGLGLAVLEAMHMGRAVLATAAGGIPESVEDGVTGRVVPVGDAAAWAAAAEALLADPGALRRMGREGARVARERFTLDAMVRGNLVAYDSCPLLGPALASRT
jgi:glycosyltransferase involved in cell wall biosynthesis